ncbi:MAG: 50S ribosomal protein L35 [Patescibacteria group bacterium]|nr:50S ribosomal protein L35 [Patescibacteria group bacterium]MDE2015111.1 50S ribosomal protein L35 [Patescibacteria group bacterium]MDE2226539.1 50S ribosomal protein L35 [Patescibacteria group bacterium]
MKKSVSKRFKLTKNGKLVRRSMSVNHFRTRKSTKNVRQKRQTRGIDYPNKKIMNY